MEVHRVHDVPETMGAINEALGQLPVRKSVWATNAFFSTNPMMIELQEDVRRPDADAPGSSDLHRHLVGDLLPALAGVITGHVSPDEQWRAARDL